MATNEIKYQASRTGVDFHKSTAFFRGIRGPVGSGKSVTCCFEALKRAWQQQPYKGVRETKCVIVRQTYGELKSTTIATWLDWFGDFTKITYGHPITGLFVPPAFNGYKARCQLVFLALDRPQDIKKLKSMEATMIWFNEASEIDPAHIYMAPSRLRYPSLAQGGMTWKGIIADTNSCDVNNWWYKFAEESDKSFEYVNEENKTEKVEYKFFDQPPALKKTSKGYARNRKAENIKNLPDGFGYYFRQLPGKPKEWVDVFICNEYGSSIPGNKVYSDYSIENHRPVEIDAGIGHIVWTHDFNFTPLSSCLLQVKDDNVYIFDEIILTSAVAAQTATEFCERYKDYKNCLIKIYGDASGHIGAKHGHDSDYIIIAKILRREGFRVRMHVPQANPAIKDGQNSLRGKVLDSLGNRSLFINPKKCKTLDKGLATVQLKKGSTFQEEDSEFQHVTTALRYFTDVEFPVKGKYVKTGQKQWK